MGTPSFKSFNQMFHHRVHSTPDSDAIFIKKDGGWLPWSWREVGRKVRAQACGLQALGVQTGERVAIISGTRPEWVVADIGIMCAAAASATIYPSNTAEEIVYILKDSGSTIAFVDSDKQVKKLQEKREELPQLRQVIAFHGASTPDGWVMPLAALEEKGDAWDKANPGAYEATAEIPTSNTLATLIYTSGTTGVPKGVMLTHDNWVYEAEAVDALGLISPSDRQFLWLPLAHSFGKTLVSIFVRIGCPTAIEGDIDNLIPNIGAFKPTFVGAPPRIFEKAYNKVVQNAKDGGALKYKIFQWAIGVGRQVSALRQQRKEPSGLLAIKYSLADKLVFSKLKERFGGRLRFFISGAAPLSRDLAEFFHAADILILEGYGLTETSAAAFVNVPATFRFGTVGAPLPGTEVKIAGDGEILIKGRAVMQGYYNMPDATTDALKDGWLYTGDIGEVDNGFLRITDRKKDLIKTSGGKYIAPADVEAKLKSRSTIVSQVVVHGNNRNFCAALFTIAEDTGLAWAKGEGLPVSTYEELVKHEKVREEINRVVEETNRDLPSYSTIKKFAILEKDFTVESGELTPSMKVKRKEVERRFKEKLDSFYEGSLASL